MPRLILALDTATERLALAVGTTDSDSDAIDGALRVIASDDHPAERQANVQLLPSIDALFSQNNLSRSDVDCVVCGLGPGSFTGVRIAVATAKGLARGLGVPLYGISTLDAVAWGAWLAGTRGRVGVAANAMRGEVYPARFELSETGARRLDAHAVIKAEALDEHWQALGAPETILRDEPPTGAGLLHAFVAARAAGEVGTGEAGTLLPIYTRLSDAEENERKRLASGGAVAQGALVEVPRSGVADPRRLEQVSYRPMALGDLDQVCALEDESFGGHANARASSGERWSRAAFIGQLSERTSSWWVAYLGDLLVGFAGGRLAGGDFEILDVAVAPAYRRRHIATELLKRLRQDGEDLGATTLTLEVRASNEAALALYASAGLEKVGERKGYYASMTAEGGGEGSEAAIIMSATATANGVEASPRILAIETSCDETAAAILDGAGNLLANIVASQVDFHARFGGVVPEIASRKHTEAIVGVVDAALEEAKLSSFRQLDAIAVTYAPGLIGALVVGVAFAKALSWATDKPLILVNHLEGHIYANKLASSSAPQRTGEAGEALKPPFIIALLSGGHTMLVHVRDWGSYRVLGQTLDDAVGEAFDKVAKALGLGYPGGPIISRLAEQGNPAAIDFPRALLHSHDLRFSLSGLKTAVITWIRNEQAAGRTIPVADVAASFQQAVIDVQVAKALDALAQTNTTTFALGGGVAANRALREAYVAAMEPRGIRVIFPPAIACTDNAAMIALVAQDRYQAAHFAPLNADAQATTNLEAAY